MKQGENAALNELLRTIDADQIAAGKPILSIVIQNKDGSLCSVTEESIRKYKLRRPGETHKDMIDRLRDEAQKFAGQLIVD